MAFTRVFGAFHCVLFLIALISFAVDSATIGIDLGTTYSCAAIMRNGQVEIIPNSQGNRITPSYVAFSPDQGIRLIGDAAKNQLTSNPKNTIYDAKRIIGRRFGEDTVQKDVKAFSFEVINKEDKPHIKVDIKGEEKHFAPEEISAMVLGEMKSIAEAYLGENVTSAVITVPAYFNDAQRQATKNAGIIAGLQVKRIINEPTAAAISYGLHEKKAGKTPKESSILVFDLGGGTFDVSLLTIDKGVFEVLATNGDTHLGGEDFDNRIVEHFSKLFKAKTGFDIRSNNRAHQRLRREAEKAKRTLSTTLTTRLEVESISANHDFSETLTRAKFEEINMDLFNSIVKPMKQVLDDAKVPASDIAEIVMVGGSSRIPKIQDIVSKFFAGKKINKAINPDEAIAYGAAVQAGVLSGESSTGELVLLDVCPLTLGMELEGGVMAKIIKRNTPIPTIKRDIFTTVVDNQNVVTTAIYEGERALVKDNHFLGQFDLTGIPPARRGVPQIQVTFEIDANGILKVSAEDRGSGNKQSIVIKNDKSRLKPEEIERMVREAEQFKEQDKKVKEQHEARSSLEQYAYTTKAQLGEKDGFATKLTKSEVNKINAALDAAIAWLTGNPNASSEEIEKEKKKAEGVVQPILSKFYKSSGAEGGEKSKDEASKKTEL